MSKTRQIYLERGRIVELIETITAHEPMKRFSGEIDGQGMLTCMLPFIKGSVRKRQGGDFERFKRLLEAGELSPRRDTA